MVPTVHKQKQCVLSMSVLSISVSCAINVQLQTLTGLLFLTPSVYIVSKAMRTILLQLLKSFLMLLLIFIY